MVSGLHNPSQPVKKSSQRASGKREEHWNSEGSYTHPIFATILVWFLFLLNEKLIAVWVYVHSHIKMQQKIQMWLPFNRPLFYSTQEPSRKLTPRVFIQSQHTAVPASLRVGFCAEWKRELRHTNRENNALFVLQDALWLAAQGPLFFVTCPTAVF